MGQVRASGQRKALRYIYNRAIMFCLFVPNCFVSFFHFSEVGMYVEDLKRFSGALASLS